MTIKQQGNVFGTVYNSGGNETVRLQGAEITTTLYYRSGGEYHMWTAAAYSAGSQRTFYKRGSSIEGLRYEGADYTYRSLGSVVVTSGTEIYKAGSGGSGDMYQIETQDVTALTAS